MSQRVAQFSGIAVSPQKPVVGESIFTKESGVAVAQLLVYPPAIETYDPELVGRQRGVILSKKSGKGSIRYMLQEMGQELDDERLDDVLREVKELGVRKKGPLTHEEFMEILRRHK